MQLPLIGWPSVATQIVITTWPTDDPRYVVIVTRQSPFLVIRLSISSTNKATHNNKRNHHELYRQSR